MAKYIILNGQVCQALWRILLSLLFSSLQSSRAMSACRSFIMTAPTSEMANLPLSSEKTFTIPCGKLRYTIPVPSSLHSLILHLSFSSWANNMASKNVVLKEYRRFLPSDNLIHNFLLLQATSSQIDTCRFDAFMPHKVCKQGNVVELFQEILGITMAERVRINHFLV